ncbi:serine/threonine-protein kinase [Tautonia sociabilis]|nr:serine/threonine-protein kinase [Tautonia sociabilis]
MEAGLPGIGDRLDSFEVQQAIGVGGMGAVFRALDVRLDRFVALKVLPPGQAHEAENVRRFYQEGRAAARLDHENIARVYTIGQDKGLHYIAFEYIDGTTIRQRVEQHGPLPVAEAINFTLQIAGALVHASERGVVHRDIKPSNIIVTQQGRAKLVDMGLARRFEREGADDGLTQSNMTLGTFDYISPEQARDPRSVDTRSDLYSLGCTIYHMLTGQPPFPGGTVLQKLLSHREEPAPDVRVLNPAVPADLSAIVLKLMAKDPDRRYQTPEQLVRDLLTLAGALGLRSISPEGLVWMNAAPRTPGLERHLFWSLPAAGLALVVGVLLWLGREPELDPALPLPPEPFELAETTSSARQPSGTSSAPAAPERSPAPPSASSSGPGLASSTPRKGAEPSATASAPREVWVRADEDLRAVLRSEPPGSTIVLRDNGPYLLEPAAGAAPIRADLTIRAAADTHPVLQAAPDEAFAADSGPLLHFAGGRVTLEGLTFRLSGSTGPAILAEGTALALSRCDIRGAGLPAAVELVAPDLEADDGPIGPDPGRMPVRLESCTLAGGRVGLLARGPMTLWLQDCSIAERGPAIWFNNTSGTPAPVPDFGFEPPPPAPSTPAAPPVPAHLVLSHVSLLAGSEPVLRFDGTSIRVVASDSLVAPPRSPEFGSGRTVLVAIDDPDRLSWMGINNLYARIDQYLATTSGGGRARIFEFDAWAGGLGIAEASSAASTEHVWVEDDPGAALARDVPPALAFRPAILGPRQASLPGPEPVPAGSNTLLGARRGPSGPIEPPETTAASPPAEIDPARLTGFDPDPMDLGPMVLSAVPTGSGPELASTPSATRSRPVEPVEGELPPGYQASAAEPNRLDPAPPPRPPAAEAEPTPASVAASATAETGADLPIRTTPQLLQRLDALGSRGGVLRLASDARLDLPAVALSGSGIVELLAEAGPTRPLLRFRPDPADPVGPSGSATMFRVDRRGELRLRGVDLVLPAEAAPGSGSWAAFSLAPEATLDLTECTLTVDGPGPSAAVLATADGPAAAPAGSSPSRPSATGGGAAAAGVRVVDSLIRSAGDVLDVAPGAQADLELSNSVVSCSGSLLLGRGRASWPAGDGTEPRLSLELRRVTAVARGGIVRLDSAADRPLLPVAEVSARESVLATGPGGGALFRVDGQGELGSLGDRIRVVESRDVAYHRVDEYRRDETSRLDLQPMVLDRDEWSLAVGRVEVDPRHGDAGFLNEDGPDTDPRELTPDDVRLDPEGIAAELGPDLDRIPPAPDPAAVAASDPAASPSRPGAEVLDRLRRALLPGLP